MANKRINSIDVARIIASFAIVALHTKFFASRYVNATLITAVSLFFMISGYFFCVSQEKKIKRIKNIFILTLMSNLLYMIVGLGMAFLQGDLSVLISAKSTLKAFLEFVILNESPFAVHLWFLSALLYCMIIDYFISKFNISKKLILAAVICLIVVGFVLGKYSILIWNGEISQIWLRNFIFTGLPYFYIGKLFMSTDISRIKINNIGLIILMVVLTAVTLAEKLTLDYFNVAASRESYISSTLFVLAVFIFLLKNPAENPSKFVSLLADWGRKYSLYIYVVHMLYFHMFKLVSTKLDGFADVYFIFGPIIAFVCSFITSVIYYRLKQMLMKKISERKLLKEG